MTAQQSYKQISAILPDDEALLHARPRSKGGEVDSLFDHHTCRGVGAIGKRSAGRRFRSPRQSF